MTSHLNSHRTTDIRPEMLSGVQTGNGTPHDKYKIRSIAHACTNRKDNIFMQRQLGQILHVYWSGAKDLYKIQTVPGPSLHNLSCACFLFSGKSYRGAPTPKNYDGKENTMLTWCCFFRDTKSYSYWANSIYIWILKRKTSLDHMAIAHLMLVILVTEI